MPILHMVLVFAIAALSSLATYIFGMRIVENLTGTGEENNPNRRPERLIAFAGGYFAVLVLLKFHTVVWPAYAIAVFGPPAVAMGFAALIATIYFAFRALRAVCLATHSLAVSVSVPFTVNDAVIRLRSLADRICPPREPGTHFGREDTEE